MKFDLSLPMINLNEIVNLEGQLISAVFDDGCALEIEIISTTHVADGGDIVAKVNRVLCQEKRNNHLTVNNFINFNFNEISSYKLIEKR